MPAPVPTPPTPESTQVTLHEGTAPADGILPWSLRWHRREAALRNVIARWREPAFARRVLPSPQRDSVREQCAAEIEAVLDAGEDPRHGGLA